MINKVLLIALLLQNLFFLLFFSTALARIPEPTPSIFSLGTAGYGLVAAFYTIKKGKNLIPAAVVLLISLIVIFMTLFAIMLARM
ncbi:hypothetical protein [Bacillus sp. JJ1562]|uniref:hypothetical protein n=1 Tax=Bacillus sp. JJ1562 TaxID=3122960 RepID=UPI0030017DDD